MRAVIFIWCIAGMIVGLMGSWRAPAPYRQDYFIAFLICTVLSAIIGYSIYRQEFDETKNQPPKP